MPSVVMDDSHGATPIRPCTPLSVCRSAGRATDVAPFTALHVPVAASSARAIPRLVSLRPLLSGQQWPDPEELVRPCVAYGEIMAPGPPASLANYPSYTIGHAYNGN